MNKEQEAKRDKKPVKETDIPCTVEIQKELHSNCITIKVWGPGINEALTNKINVQVGDLEFILEEAKREIGKHFLTYGSKLVEVDYADIGFNFRIDLDLLDKQNYNSKREQQREENK